MQIDVIDNTNNDLSRQIETSLKAHNASFGFTTEQEDITVAVTEDGEFLGGATIMAKWNWVYVDNLYVAKKRQGIGAKIMQQVENIARDKGKVGVYLYTGAFQTPEFYTSLGYIETARIPSFVGPHDEILMVKKFA